MRGRVLSGRRVEREHRREKRAWKREEEQGAHTQRGHVPWRDMRPRADGALCGWKVIRARWWVVGVVVCRSVLDWAIGR